MSPYFSIIIPLGPSEPIPCALISDIQAALRVSHEILLAPGERRLEEAQDQMGEKVSSSFGRAHQMNAAAKRARGAWLWFVHADSTLTPVTVPYLLKATTRGPRSIYFSRLEFAGDRKIMKLNEWGVRLRSELLKIPFGDQGFLVCKTLFDELGGFDITAPFGEDHLFVWEARRRGIAIQPTGGTILTSARKYVDQGWLRVTLNHLWLTIMQATREYLRGVFCLGERR